MTTTNTYGRQVVVPLTNKSGGAVAVGDVVIVDTGNNEAFTTTTAAAFTGGVGIAQETIANNAVGRVLLEGYAALVNVNASVTRGNFGKTHTVAKQAADGGSSRVTGTFCQFLTGGTSPTARIYPPDLGAGSGTAGTALILDFDLAADINGVALTQNTFVDVLANQNFTVQASGSIIEIAIRGFAFNNATVDQSRTRIVIDSAGTPINKMVSAVYGSAAGGTPANQLAGTNSIFVSGLTAGVHTIKLQNTNASALPGAFYCRATSSNSAECMSIQIVEHKN